MITNDYFKRPRKKAWIGTAISTAAGIGSSIFGAIQQRKAQQRQFNLQQNTQAREVGLQSAANLTQAYANYDELDKEFQNRFLRYGGRRKAELGTEEKTEPEEIETETTEVKTPEIETEGGNGYKWSNSDTSSIISGIGSAVGNIAGSIIGNNVNRSRRVFNPIKINPVNRNNEAVYDSAARSNVLNNYYKVATLRAGGYKSCKR